MPRTEQNYTDRVIKCSGCRKFILKTAMDAQVLILENGLILYNCAFWKCPKCETFGSFVSPILPNEKPTLDNQFPDALHLERRAAKLKGITKLAFNRYRVRIHKDGKEKYIGVYESEAEAIRARKLALAALQ